jgi:3' exoribonuclease, RNase T-like
MTKVFLDTEFVDDGRVIDPVSLSLVSETGAEYYAVFADGGVDRAVRDEWLRVNVVPHLPVVLTDGGGWAWDTAHADYPRVRPRARIAAEVRAFVGGQPEPELWAYYSPFDAVVLYQLYGPMSGLPAEIPMFVRDLMQESGRGSAALPEQAPPVHHALHDARHDRRIAQAIGLI